MSQLVIQDHGPRLSVWSILETQLKHGGALLLPLRIFIGLGWLRAGVEKLIDPLWTSGEKLPLFFQTQLDAGAVYFPFYETLIHQLFEPNALVLSWIILLGELLAGVAIMSGTVTNLALLGGLFMNLNFVLAGVVNPSAFYIVIQAALFASNAGSTMGGDSFLSRYIHSVYLVAQPHFEEQKRPIGKWAFFVGCIICCITATLIVPYIRDFGPHGIDDPAMLLFIMFMLGAMLMGILFTRMSLALSAQTLLPQPYQALPAAAYADSDVSTLNENNDTNSALTEPSLNQFDANEQKFSRYDLNRYDFNKYNLNKYRRFVYPGLLVLLYITWFSYMSLSESWHLFSTLWPVSLTMTLGSFVAGATAEGGAAIAFPVFTKVLHIASPDARTFGLMIQAVGMTMAGIVILLKGIKILPRVILWATLGGAIGQVAGAYWLHLPNPYPKILFTFIATVFGLALIISRWGLKWEPRATLHKWTNSERFIFLVVGLCGGAFAAITGSGIDMLTFIVLTLAFGINEKISTPTTVIIMALNSIVGFALHGLFLQDIGVAWNYWLVAVPIVVIGAPLGALAASYLKRDHIIFFLVSLITLELVTTILLIPFSPHALFVTTIAMASCSLVFAAMLFYRQTVVQAVWAPVDGEDSDGIMSSSGQTKQVGPSGSTVTESADYPMIRVCCTNCYQTQDAVNGDCIWCGTSLTFAESIHQVTREMVRAQSTTNANSRQTGEDSEKPTA